MIGEWVISGNALDRFLAWNVVGSPPGTVPRRIVTARPPDRLGALAPLDALLLPAGDHLAVDAVTPPLPDAHGADCAAGLFLAHPFRTPDRLAESVARRGYGWLCNLPGIDRHDREFRSFLEDVDLSLEREERVLRRARDAGLRVLLCMSEPRRLGWKPDAVMVVPPVGGTVPPVRAFRAQGIDVPVIAPAADPEADARVRRPVPFTP